MGIIGQALFAEKDKQRIEAFFLSFSSSLKVDLHNLYYYGIILIINNL